MFKSSSVPIKYFALFHTASLFQVYNKEFTTGSTKITPAKKKKKKKKKYYIGFRSWIIQE